MNANITKTLSDDRKTNVKPYWIIPISDKLPPLPPDAGLSEEQKQKFITNDYELVYSSDEDYNI